MNLSAPHTSVLSDTNGRVLSVLAGTTKPLAGREIGRIAGISQNGAWRALTRMVEQGLVLEQEAGGRTLLYTLNRDHLAAGPAIALTRLRSTLIEKIKDELAQWKIKPRHASLFGSAARGDGDTESDIDIFLVRPPGTDEEDVLWRSQINSLCESIYKWTGNRAGSSEVRSADVTRLRRERPPIVKELESDGIPLVGQSATELFSSKRR